MFLEEFIRGTHQIAEAPERWPVAPEYESARRCRLDPFPYSLVYMIEPTHCMIVAVASLLRKPGYWIDRLK